MQQEENRPRILLVEDEPNVAQVMRSRLESYAYEVCDIVSSGADAIQATERMAPDIILMDIKIRGDIDGIESARRIRSFREIPVIFITSYADENLLKRAKITEPFGYIMKPYESAQLRITVEMALFRHRLERERQILVEDLKAALTKVKKLSGLLPICASCKNIRDDKGYWNKLEAYIQQNSEAEFTHSICPECRQKLYPGLSGKP